LAGPVADRIEAAQASGQLRVAVGRIRDYEIRNGLIDVLYRPRGREALDTIRVARVVNCSGPGADYERIQEPLIRSLLSQGIVRPDPLRLGLDVTANCALLDRSGAISRRLFAVGPVTKGAFGEMTAVPDIRRQTELVAEYLVGLVRSAAPAVASQTGEQRR
jgi:uncharacterized NAD(P)/FAD-binding protein YdhS